MPSNYIDPTADGASNAWTKSTGTAGWSLVDDAVRQPTAPTTGSDNIASTTTAGTLQDLVFPNTLTYNDAAIYKVWVYGKHGNRTGWSTLISTDDSSFANEVSMVAASTPAGAFAWSSRDITSLITSQGTLDGLRVRLKTLTIAGGGPTASEVDAVYLEQATFGTLSNTFEGGTDTTAITTGNSGGASGDAFTDINLGTGDVSVITYTAAPTAHGRLSGKYFVPANIFATTTWLSSFGGINWPKLWGRFYFQVDAFPTGTWVPCMLATDAATVAWMLFSSSGGLSVVTAASGTVASGSQTHSAGTWYRVEWRYVAGTTTGVIEAKTYLGDSTSQFDIASGTNTNTAAGIQQVAMGNYTSANTQDITFYLDDINVNGSGFPGPSPISLVYQPFRQASTIYNH